MDVTNRTPTVYNRIQRHAAKLEQIDFLLVNSRNLLVRIGQARERDIVFPPIAHVLLQRIRPNRQDFRFACDKLSIPIPQARQLRAAERSHEATQEGQDNDFSSAKIRKAERLSSYIFQLKVWCKLTV